MITGATVQFMPHIDQGNSKIDLRISSAWLAIDVGGPQFSRHLFFFRNYTESQFKYLVREQPIAGNT